MKSAFSPLPQFPSKSPAAIVGLLQRYLEKTKAEICEYEVMKVNDKPVCEYDLSALFSPSLGESVEILIDKKEGNRLVVLLPRDDRRSYNLAPLHALLSALVVGASTPDALLGQDQLRLHMGSVWQDHLDKAKRALDQPIVDTQPVSLYRGDCDVAGPSSPLLAAAGSPNQSPRQSSPPKRQRSCSNLGRPTTPTTTQTTQTIPHGAKVCRPFARRPSPPIFGSLGSAFLPAALPADHFFPASQSPARVLPPVLLVSPGFVPLSRSEPAEHRAPAPSPERCHSAPPIQRWPSMSAKHKDVLIVCYLPKKLPNCYSESAELQKELQEAGVSVLLQEGKEPSQLNDLLQEYDPILLYVIAHFNRIARDDGAVEWTPAFAKDGNAVHIPNERIVETFVTHCHKPESRLVTTVWSACNSCHLAEDLKTRIASMTVAAFDGGSEEGASLSCARGFASSLRRELCAGAPLDDLLAGDGLKRAVENGMTEVNLALRRGVSSSRSFSHRNSTATPPRVLSDGTFDGRAADGTFATGSMVAYNNPADVDQRRQLRDERERRAAQAAEDERKATNLAERKAAERAARQAMAMASITRFQALTRGHSARLRLSRATAAAVKLQARARGYSVRCSTARSTVAASRAVLRCSPTRLVGAVSSAVLLCVVLLAACSRPM